MKTKEKTERAAKVATQNACKLCTPLGACLAFKGLESCVPLLHGSQGCATYIRRYSISHFREPLDIASSSFTEDTAIFGGANNLKTAIRNISSQYQPQVIGIASTCLSETIGEDLNMLVKEFLKEVDPSEYPTIVSVSTPSYRGTHRDGYWDAVGAILENLAGTEPTGTALAEHGGQPTAVVVPGLVSPEDLRSLKQVFDQYGISLILMGDYSETLDGGVWDAYQSIPPGGTKVDAVRSASRADFAMDFTFPWMKSGSSVLEKKFEVRRQALPLPLGIRLCDDFHRKLSELSGLPIPEPVHAMRRRLLDAYTDAHKYTFGMRALVYGEPELVYSTALFLDEIGIIPVFCATGSRDKQFAQTLSADLSRGDQCHVMEDLDFEDMEQLVQEGQIDLMVGNSKGYKLSKKLGVPLVRMGFPIHDRFGAARVRHFDYVGTFDLFDRIVNALLEKKQQGSSVGYTYI